MKRKTERSDAVLLIRFAAILWLIYLMALAAINQLLGRPQRTDPLYYILNAVVALICLGLTLWPWVQARLGRTFIPLIIALSTVAPILVDLMINIFFPVGPQFYPDSPLLRPLPFLFMGLLLVAWQYRWQFIMLVIFCISGLNLAVQWISAPPRVPVQGLLSTTLIQTVIFLALGFSISYLMTRLRRQQQSLEAANTHLSHYASTLEHLATSQERNRLARELHDTLAHTLSGLSVQLETMKAYWDVDNKAARAILDKSLVSAHTGLEETRRALKALRASPLDDLGLALAIGNMAKENADRAKINLNLLMSDNIPALTPDIEQCVYRIAQEAVTNVVNHSQAKNMLVKLEYADSKITLEVHDDGIGFSLENNNQAGHFGLVGMHERAQLIGGTLTVTSKPGEGTTVILKVLSGI
jgi:signal transduction histidine kinase